METKDILKQLREKSGYTIKEVATKIGMQYSACREYESGDRNLGMSAAIKFADFYGVTIDCLLGREPAPDPFGAYNLSEATEQEVVETFLSLPPEIRACILDIMAQLGGAVERSRTPQNADADEYEEITLGEIEDARNAEIQTYEKDAG